MTDMEKRTRYIAASDKRVSAWPTSKQEAFNIAVSRMNGTWKLTESNGEHSEDAKPLDGTVQE